MSQVFKDATPAQQKQLQKEYRDFGILDKWHDKTWADFTNDARAKDIIQSYLKDPKKPLSDGVGLFLSGQNGVGKTLLLNLAFQDLYHKGYKVKIISMSGLITLFAGGWYDVEDRRTLIQIMQKVQFLGIEEIGKEFKPGGTDLGLTVFDNVLRQRVQMKKPTWFTTNKKDVEITDIYSEDIASMLRESCLSVAVTGKDYRKTIASEIKEKYKI